MISYLLNQAIPNGITDNIPEQYRDVNKIKDSDPNSRMAFSNAKWNRCIVAKTSMGISRQTTKSNSSQKSIGLCCQKWWQEKEQD